MPRPRLNPDRVLTPAEKQAAYRERQKQAYNAKLEEEKLLPAPPIANMPGTARWSALLKTALAALETCSNEMQAYYDDRSEQWQEGEKGEAFQERIDTLTELADNLRDIT